MKNDRLENNSTDTWSLTETWCLSLPEAEKRETSGGEGARLSELRPMEGRLEGDQFECYYGTLFLN